MKRLNNKGFTLIELLAVIIILAIVVAITIPNVLTSIGGARNKTFENSVATVADWLEKEYQLSQAMDESTAGKVSTGYSGFCTDNCSTENTAKAADTAKGFASSDTAGYNMLKAAGVKPSNYSIVKVTITDGRACVKLTASTNGDYKGASEKLSSGC